MEYQTDHLSACYALSRAATPADLRETLLANMMGLARASAGLLFGRSDTGDLVALGSLPAMLDVQIPDLSQAERNQHPLAGLLASPVALIERPGSPLAQARLALFDIPGRLLVIPAAQEGRSADLVFVLLLPLVVGPSSDDIAALTIFGQFGARMNRLLLQVQTEGVARKDLSRALTHADQDRARVLNTTLPGLLSGRLVGRSAVMQDLRRDIAKFGQSHLPVLVTGETGTGKELVARELHRISNRGEGPFIALNVAALPADLLESELFGHARGAFTGATSARKGLIAEADKGTLFLDEIGDMALPLQAKLLRVLQERRFRPVGSDKEIASDFRLICATHRDLPAAIEAGGFRRDLFYRIASIHLAIAPLRDRRDDIGALASHFLTEISQREDTSPRALSDAALAALSSQPFPGNVRQLQSIIERAAISAGDGNSIEPEHLAPSTAGTSAAPTISPILPSLLADEGLVASRERFERFLMIEQFMATGGDRSAMANRLGIPLSTLNRKLNSVSLQDDVFTHAIADGLSSTPSGENHEPIDVQAACDALERQLILDAHGASGGDRRVMAEKLRVSLSTLADKLKRYRLVQPNSPEGPLK